MQKRIPIYYHWDKIAKHYYANPDIQDRGHTIWDWLRKEYGAKILHRSPPTINSHIKNDLLEFEKEEDLTLFLLRWS
jgi:hypothetical protein